METDGDRLSNSVNGETCVENVLVFGKTGVGKTTTLNALFGLHWATDHAIACTKMPTAKVLTNERYPNLSKVLRVVDLPGIGESLAADQEYWSFYVEWMPRADRLLWITQADTRAYKRDELFLRRLKGMFKPTLRLTVGLNKADCLGIDEGCQGFDPIRQQLSDAQVQQISTKVDDVYALFGAVLGVSVDFSCDDIVPYSATSGWGILGLRQLFFNERMTHVR